MPIAKRSSKTALQKAIERADRILPGKPAPDDQRDPRWQAIIKVGEHIEEHPLEVWRFARKWGVHASWDLRAAVATCLVEHLLEHHYGAIMPLVEDACGRSKRFADAVAMCWAFGQTLRGENQRRFEQLLERIQKSSP
jgi:hypothetical protein